MIIGLGHQARVGKDTVADILVARYGFVRKSFAEPIRKAAIEIFDFSKKQLVDEFKEQVDDRWGFSPREAMQKIGTDCVRRVFGEDFWIKRLMLEVAKLNADVVITDVRFKNEFKAIREMGGYLIKVTRPTHVKVKNHISEMELEQERTWDEILDNSSSIENLPFKIAMLDCMRDRPISMGIIMEVL